MNRYASETRRLYGWDPAESGGPTTTDGASRAMVWVFPRPSAWPDVAEVWQGVQTVCGWPAPAIAVDGVGAYQLWFALVQAVTADQARTCLAQVLQRVCPHLPHERMGVYPGDTSIRLPGGAVVAEQWSAFVAPDLAALFADTPWLDGPPNPDAQADLLCRFDPTPPTAWEALLQVPATGAAVAPVGDSGGLRYTDPLVFLADVMNNPAADWMSRVEAAKALLARGRSAPLE